MGELGTVEYAIKNATGRTVGVVDVTYTGFSYLLDDDLDELLARLSSDRAGVVRTLRDGRQWVEFNPPFDHVAYAEILLGQYLEENGHTLTADLGLVLSVARR